MPPPLPVRDAQTQADEFMAANDRSPVTVMSTRAAGGRGVWHTLLDGSGHYLSMDAMGRLLPGYPRWDVAPD